MSPIELDLLTTVPTVGICPLRQPLQIPADGRLRDRTAITAAVAFTIEDLSQLLLRVSSRLPEAERCVTTPVAAHSPVEQRFVADDLQEPESPSISSRLHLITVLPLVPRTGLAREETTLASLGHFMHPRLQIYEQAIVGSALSP